MKVYMAMHCELWETQSQPVGMFDTLDKAKAAFGPQYSYLLWEEFTPDSFYIHSAVWRCYDRENKCWQGWAVHEYEVK